MGMVAVVAARLAARQSGAGGWLAIWTVAAMIAMAIGLTGAALKSRRFQMPLFSGPGRKFIAGFTPAILAGAVLTMVLLPGRRLRISTGRVASALWRRGVRRRVGIGTHRAHDGRVLYVCGTVAPAARLERCPVARWVRRSASDFRNSDRGEIWRVNQTRYGANAKSARSLEAVGERPSSTAWCTNGCAWEFSPLSPLTNR